MKLQRLQNRVIRPIVNFDRRTPVREIYVALKFPYVYDYLIKLCRKSLEVMENTNNLNTM
jgi:hypothetical protein